MKMRGSIGKLKQTLQWYLYISPVIAPHPLLRAVLASRVATIICLHMPILHVKSAVFDRCQCRMIAPAIVLLASLRALSLVRRDRAHAKDDSQLAGSVPLQTAHSSGVGFRADLHGDAHTNACADVAASQFHLPSQH
jgi:hypothetical protein